METADCDEIVEDQPSEFLTASQLVSLRKPDEDPVRCVVGEKYYTHSNTWLENKAVECALESFKDTLLQKRATRLCDLMQAEWNEEVNASITSKLKGKFVQHMGRAFNGKIALSPEESIFLLENGCIEILNGKAPLSTEEAYKVMLKENLSAEKYQVYSQLSQLGFIVVPHQTELGVTKYEKRINLDQYPMKRKRQTVPDAGGEPEKKRLSFSGAFSNKPEILINCENQETPSISTTENPVAEVLVAEPEVNCHRDESSVHDKVDDEIKNSDVAAVSMDENKENLSSNAANSATIVDEIEEVPSSAVNTTIANQTSNEDTPHQSLSASALNETNAPVYCSKSSENSKGIEVELETVEVGASEEISVHHEEADSQSHLDTNSNPVPESFEPTATSCLSKNSIDVMNVDSENTEISCTSEVSRNNNVSNPNINVTLEDSSCSVMDALGLPDNQDCNSDIMSCSSENDDVLSIGSECDLSDNVPEDDEIELLEVTKKETKPLAVIDLLSDDEKLDSELSGSDDEIQVVKVCNGVHSNVKSHAVDSLLKNSNRCKKEERGSPVSSSNQRRNISQLTFPSCARKDLVCVARPPAKYLPHNVCLSKEAYMLNFKPNSEQPPRVWNSFREMREYQHARRQNRYANHLLPSFQNREGSRRITSGRDARQNFNQRRTGSNEHDEPRWGDGVSHRDARHNVNSKTNHYLDPPPQGDVKRNLNHTNTNSPDVFVSYPNPERSPWLDRNPNGPLREDGPNFTPSRSMDSTEAFSNTPAFSSAVPPFNASRGIHQNPFRYAVPNAAAAINSVVSVSNQDMNVSMVGNHILHPPLHSSSPHLPSFNANLPSLTAIGPVDIMAEVQRTAYTVATSMLSSMFGQNVNHHAVNPHLPPFNAFQPVQNNPYGFPSQFNSVFNAQNFNSEQILMQNRLSVREPLRRQHYNNPFPCQYRNLRNRSSWNEVKEAIGDDGSSLDVGSDVEEVPISPTDVLWDSKTISPLVKPGTKYPTSEVFKKLQITHTANLLSNSLGNKACFSTTCSIEISFDVYLPGTNYKKTCPGIPKHRIIVVRSTDPIPRYSDLAFLQKKWSDGATLQVAVVDNGDISYQSFNSVHLPVLIPHEK